VAACGLAGVSGRAFLSDYIEYQLFKHIISTNYSYK